jgi:hypothetical protein
MKVFPHSLVSSSTRWATGSAVLDGAVIYISPSQQKLCDAIFCCASKGTDYAAPSKAPVASISQPLSLSANIHTPPKGELPAISTAGGSTAIPSISSIGHRFVVPMSTWPASPIIEAITRHVFDILVQRHVQIWFIVVSVQRPDMMHRTLSSMGTSRTMMMLRKSPTVGTLPYRALVGLGHCGKFGLPKQDTPDPRYRALFRCHSSHLWLRSRPEKNFLKAHV